LFRTRGGRELIQNRLKKKKKGRCKRSPPPLEKILGQQSRGCIYCGVEGKGDPPKKKKGKKKKIDLREGKPQAHILGPKGTCAHSLALMEGDKGGKKKGHSARD